MFLVSYFVLMVFVLFTVAFVILLERKELGCVQLRKGPNKVGYLGLIQPFSDGFSLFFKEINLPICSNFFIYYASPLFMLILSFLLWVLFPFLVNSWGFDYGILFLLSCLGVSVYGVLLSGWSSNSNYALLGSIRSVAQTISYEVSLVLIMSNVFLFVFSFNFIEFYKFHDVVWGLFMSFPLFFCWFSSCLAETSRSPFDFVEGESELVSGFNVEYGGFGFAFIFLSEYMNIVFMGVLSSVLFLGCKLNSILFFFEVLFFVVVFIWVRATLPRYRYDSLMSLTWKFFLPLSLNYFLFFTGVLMFIV